MVLTKNKVKLMDLCFNNNFPILFEYSKGSYDNIIVKGITSYNDFKEYKEEDRKMLLDMQKNIYTHLEIIKYFKDNFPKYILHKSMGNLGGDKIQLIFSNDTEKGNY